jgi:excisionase family DNA binding protein
MSKANLYSGAGVFSKRSRTGQSKSIQSDSPQHTSLLSVPDPTPAFEPLFDSVEAARRVDIHPKTLVRMARRGQINGIRFGRLWRFRLSDLQQFVDAHSCATNVSSGRTLFSASNSWHNARQPSVPSKQEEYVSKD